MIRLFSLTIFIASTLIFCIQPLIGKILLPKYGSSAGVWNSCVLFFQISLFMGYLYAIFINKIKSLNKQIILHLAFFMGAILYSFGILKLGFDGAYRNGIIQSYRASPELQIIIYLLVLLSPALIIISATSPLIQSWYSKTNFKYASNPYPLYSVSNIANIFGLVLFVLFLEPTVGNQLQYSSWNYTLLVLFVLFVVCGYEVYKHNITTIIGLHEQENLYGFSINSSFKIIATFFGLTAGSRENTGAKKSSEEITARYSVIQYTVINYKRIMYWLALSAIPASLLLSTSQLITTNIVTVPLFWVVPLILYLLSFALAFARKKYFKISKLNYAIALILPVLIFYKIAPNNPSAIFFNLFIFFIVCLLSHYYLYINKPSTQYLTFYYLVISIGGILGSSFNTFIASHLFHDYYEYPIVLSLSILLFNYRRFGFSDYLFYVAFLIFFISALSVQILIYQSYYYLDFKNIVIMLIITILISSLLFVNKKILFSMCTLVIAVLPVLKDNFNNVLYVNRNFYGKQTVIQNGNVTRLMSGSIVHGMQAKNEATYTYYKPVGDILQMVPAKLNIAAVGLGTGTISCLKKPRDKIDFIEINPDMINIAANKVLFTYINDCNQISITQGDGRLKLEHAQDNYYDVIILDAFNGGNIPAHLMTQEAVVTYTKKLKSTGIILFHISNRYLNLSYVLSSVSKELGLRSFELRNNPENPNEFPSHWVALMPSSSNDSFNLDLLQQVNSGWQKLTVNHQVVWTDDYTNILSVIR